MIGIENTASAFLHVIIAIFGGICGGLIYDVFKNDDNKLDD